MPGMVSTPLSRAPRPIAVGLTTVSLATLMSEVALSRIFSVTMWYHFAFVAISLAMFGMTAGALLVYLCPKRFPIEGTRRQMALGALGFALTTVTGLLTHLSVPFAPSADLVFLFAAILQFSALALPFIFSGICVCLALTRFPRSVGALYAADLAGAALGCLGLLALLGLLDGPSAVLVVAAFGAAASWVLAERASRLRRAALLVAAGLILLATINALLAAGGHPLVRLVWVKGVREEPSYERWNSFSRIRVYGDPRTARRPFGWGLSPNCPSQMRVRQLAMNIDAHAGTVLTHFDGTLAPHEYLGYDVVNVAHHLRHDADVLVLGVGGGRDILAALWFGQRSVTGVEINGAILETLNQRYGDFTGHLDRVPGVRFVEDEGRSWLARQTTHFGIIQVSLLDTWAATAAGAFALTENSIYTRESFDIFIQHLLPDGLLSVSRWYHQGNPGEIERLAALAGASLRARGVVHPGAHVVLVRGARVATLLVRPTPFPAEMIERLESLCASYRFEVLASPRSTPDPILASLISGRDLPELLERLPLDVSPPTDDRPFFFHMLKAHDVLLAHLAQQGDTQINITAVFVLGALLVVLLVLTLLGIALPLAIARPRPSLRGCRALGVYFLAIGLGFMIVEVAQMQRLTIFLGHPVYSLAVVLFTLLSSAGLGSLVTQRLGQRPGRRDLLFLAATVLVVFACGLFTPPAARHFQSASTFIRILVAVALLAPMGLFMGTAFPLGMRLAACVRPALTPWLWGINGAASVLASVLAVAVALFYGISRAFDLGLACYALALPALAMALRSARLKTEP